MKALKGVLAAIALVVVLSFAGLIGKTVGKSMLARFFGGEETPNITVTDLRQMATQFNQQGQFPRMIDQVTRYDGVVAVDRTLRHNYTLVKHAAEEINPSVVEQARAQLITSFCFNEGMEVFIENDIPVEYAYHDKHGNHVFSTTILPSDCVELRVRDIAEKLSEEEDR